MSIYDKSVDRLTTADLQELLDANAVENVRLEFKREPPGPDETLKKLSSFANTFGGYLVVGAEARSADGRLVALPGVDPQANYKQTIIQRCAGGVSPLLQPFVSDGIPTPAGDGKVCYVVYVPESETAPHFLNNRKGAYVRTDEYSRKFEPQLATDVELRHLFDRRRRAVEQRDALVRRAGERFSRFEGREYGARRSGIRADSMPPGEAATTRIAVVPSHPTAPLCDIPTLRALITLDVSSRRGQLPGTDVVSQHESLLVLHPLADFSVLEVNTWGLVGYAAVAEARWTPAGGGGQMGGIRVPRLLGEALVLLEYAGLVYDRLGFDGTITIYVAIERIHGVALWAFPEGPAGPAHQLGVSRFDDRVAFDHTVSTSRLRHERDAVATDLLRTLLFALGWDGAVGADDPSGTVARSLLKAAYDFNGWKMTDRT